MRLSLVFLRLFGVSVLSQPPSLRVPTLSSAYVQLCHYSDILADIRVPLPIIIWHDYNSQLKVAMKTKILMDRKEQWPSTFLTCAIIPLVRFSVSAVFYVTILGPEVAMMCPNHSAKLTAIFHSILKSGDARVVSLKPLGFKNIEGKPTSPRVAYWIEFTRIVVRSQEISEVDVLTGIA